MKELIFNSSIACLLTDFTKLKRLAGYDYSSQGYLLMIFDQFLIRQEFHEKILTEKIVQAYLKTIHHLLPRSFTNRFGVLRLFSIWLNQHNAGSYILEKIIHKDNSYSRPAYIFTDNQIKIFLEKSAEFNMSVEKIPNLYQTLFSLLYTTGVRIREALSLNFGDYDPQGKLLHIRQGKFKKERYVVLSNSMNEKLKGYLQKYSLLFPLEAVSPLFIGMRKKRLIYNSVHTGFRQLINELPDFNIGKNQPRIHDLRHTFAVHRLLQWYDDDSKEDINVKLPFLSTYMGHVKITSTQIYLHATNELLQKGCDRFHHFFFDNNNKEELV